MTDVICPKFSPGPWAFTGECDWNRHEDNTCQYCGSINPDVFMARIEEGTVELGPTDKSYKVYVVGEGFQQSFRDCPKDAKCTGPDDCTHWVTRPHSHMKFYFEHLSFEQRSRFVDLFNEKKLKFEGGEGFYVLPFFMRRA